MRNPEKARRSQPEDLTRARRQSEPRNILRDGGSKKLAGVVVVVLTADSHFSPNLSRCQDAKKFRPVFGFASCLPNTTDADINTGDEMICLQRQCKLRIMVRRQLNIDASGAWVVNSQFCERLWFLLTLPTHFCLLLDGTAGERGCLSGASTPVSSP